MISLIFFSCVAFIVFAVFLALSWRNRKNNTSHENQSNSIAGGADEVRRSHTAFNETPRDFQDRVVPTQFNRNDFNDEKEANDDRPVS